VIEIKQKKIMYLQAIEIIRFLVSEKYLF